MIQWPEPHLLLPTNAEAVAALATAATPLEGCEALPQGSKPKSDRRIMIQGQRHTKRKKSLTEAVAQRHPSPRKHGSTTDHYSGKRFTELQRTTLPRTDTITFPGSGESALTRHRGPIAARADHHGGWRHRDGTHSMMKTPPCYALGS